MNSVFFSRAQYLGLCAYVNQAELSLDRTRSDARGALADFYRTQVRQSIGKVIKSLRKLLGKHDIDSLAYLKALETSSASWVSNGVIRITSFLTWTAFGGVRLPVHDLVNVVVALERFAKILAAPEAVPQEELTALRLRLAIVACNLDRRLPSRSLAAEARGVSHLNQAEHLKLKGVDEIAGSSWLSYSGEESNKQENL